MISTYQLYSETFGDWPIVCYFTFYWLAFSLIVNVIMKQILGDVKTKIVNEESKEQKEMSCDKGTNQSIKTSTSTEKDIEQASKSLLKRLYVAYIIDIRQNADLRRFKNYVQDIVCIVNALWCSVYGAYLLYKRGIVYDQVSVPEEQFQINVALAYFVADSLYSSFYNIFPNEQKLHHIGCLIGLGVSTNRGLFSNEVVFCLAHAEASNIFLCIRDILKLENIQSGKLFLASNIGFILSFMTLRIYATFTLLPQLQAATKPLYSNLSAIAIYWLSWLWIFQMCNFAVKYFAEANPDNNVLTSYHNALKALRPPKPKETAEGKKIPITIYDHVVRPMTIYYIFITWLTSRHLIRNYFGVQWI